MEEPLTQELAATLVSRREAVFTNNQANYMHHHHPLKMRTEREMLQQPLVMESIKMEGVL